MFLTAKAALAAAVFLYVFEVVARYAFDAPTSWSGEAVQYLLAVLIFAALPEVTRTKSHVAIEIVFDAVDAHTKHILARLTHLVGALTCGAIGAIGAHEAYSQFVRKIMTNAAHPIPRWWITAIVAIGLLSAGLYFARQIAEAEETQ